MDPNRILPPETIANYEILAADNNDYFIDIPTHHFVALLNSHKAESAEKEKFRKETEILNALLEKYKSVVGGRI